MLTSTPQFEAALPECVGTPSTGAHIVFTGIDGSGKSTQAGLLRRRLEEEGYCTYLLESKEDFVGNTMRAIAARRGLELRDYFGDEQTDLARAFDTLRYHIQTVVPLTGAGAIVVQPRSGYCRLGAAAAFGSRNVAQVEEVLFFVGEPSLTLWLDVPTGDALRRIDHRGIDSEDPELLDRFRQMLVALSSRGSWVRIDGTKNIEEVHTHVWETVRLWLERTRREILRRPALVIPA